MTPDQQSSYPFAFSSSPGADLPDLSTMAHDFVELVLAGEPAAASAFVRKFVDDGLPVIQALDNILRPALYETGDRWEHGDLLVSQEKIISEIARDLIAELSVRAAYPEANGPLLLACCVEGEQHQLGLRMLCCGLTSVGYRVRYLGPSVELRYLEESIGLLGPAGILLSLSTSESATSFPGLLERLNGIDTSQIKVVVGGQGLDRVERNVLDTDQVVPVQGSMLEAISAISEIVSLPPVATH